MAGRRGPLWPDRGPADFSEGESDAEGPPFIVVYARVAAVLGAAHVADRDTGSTSERSCAAPAIPGSDVDDADSFGGSDSFLSDDDMEEDEGFASDGGDLDEDGPEDRPGAFADSDPAAPFAPSVAAPPHPLGLQVSQRPQRGNNEI